MKMANVPDSVISLWLRNKLEISNDSWTGGSIFSQLNAEVLRNIKDCFPGLQTQVKVKLLLSFFHIPRRNQEEWKSELEQILEIALIDSELWVAMLAEVLKTHPETSQLMTEISDVDEVRPVFKDLVTNLRRLPMECHYLNKSALVSVVGHKPEPLKSFTIKKKPKFALLWADLLEKSSDVASNMAEKTCDPVIPVRSRGMPRQMTDTTPLEGIPSRVPTSGFRSSALTININNKRPLSIANAGRKEGGVKLLNIADQPLGYGAAKKRRKLQDIEDAKNASENSTSLQIPPPSNTNTTPDYAAGLTATPLYAPVSPAPIAEPAAATPSLAATANISSPPQASPSTSAPSPTIVTQQVQQLPQKSKIIAPQLVATVLPRRRLDLTREQMLEAQDMTGI